MFANPSIMEHLTTSDREWVRRVLGEIPNRLRFKEGIERSIRAFDPRTSHIAVLFVELLYLVNPQIIGCLRFTGREPV